MDVTARGLGLFPPTAVSAALLSALLAAGASSQEMTVTLEPSKDNTIFEVPPDASGGASQWIFSGETARRGTRRALLAFDLTGEIPAGSEIEAVSLTLHVSRADLSLADFSLHRVLGDWGEGATGAGQGGGGGGGGGATAEPGDATWLQRFAGDAESAWTSPGGDFVGTASATAAAGLSENRPVWSSEIHAALVDDVQAWVDEPSENGGWILVGEEDGSSSAVRFDSREATTAADRPMLEVTFVPEPSSEFLGAVALLALALILRWVGRGQPEKYFD